MTLRKVVLDRVEPGSTVSTDELYSYNLLTGDGYQHGTVKHGQREYTLYDYRTGVNHHVNSVEGFLAAVQGVGAVNARRNQPQVHEPLSE